MEKRGQAIPVYPRQRIKDAIRVKDLVIKEKGSVSSRGTSNINRSMEGHVMQLSLVKK